MPDSEEKQNSKMTHRQRLLAAINHKSLDRLCVDFGACGQTGIGAGAVHKIRKALLGDESPVKIIEPYQMLGEIDDQLMKALDIDVAGVIPPYTMFGFKNENFKPFEMFDGTPVLVPEKFNFTTSQNGDLLMYPQGDTCPAQRKNAQRRVLL